MNANDEKSVKIEVMGPSDGLSDSEIQAVKKLIESMKDVSVSESPLAAPKDAKSPPAPKDAKSPLAPKEKKSPVAPEGKKSPVAVINVMAAVASVALQVLGMWHDSNPDFTIEIFKHEKEDILIDQSGIEIDQSGIVIDQSGIEYEKFGKSLDNSNTGMSVLIWRQQDR